MRVNPIQSAYIKPDVRKTHLLIIDGAIASASAITFFRLEIDVIVSNGPDGAFHPCCITREWGNARTRRDFLDMASALQVPHVGLENSHACTRPAR